MKNILSVLAKLLYSFFPRSFHYPRSSSQAETRAELGMQSAHQAVTDHQQADFSERERLDSGLLAWQPTQDVHYLQAIAQRNTLTAVQNKQGDT